MARQSFDAFAPLLLHHEGGYVDHPRDPGGATNMGITQATLSAWRGRPVSKAEVRALTKEEALRIYRARYWSKTGPDGADTIPAGPDVALFDVAVNSGVGRAKAWYPLMGGKSPVEAVKAICNRRRAFFRSLSTFDVFGKGWMRRVNEVEAFALRLALNAGAIAPPPARKAQTVAALQQEAAQSDAKAKQAGTGAVATTGASGAATQVEQVAQVDWLALAAVGLPVAILIGVLIYHAIAQAGRARAMKEAADV